MKKHIVITAFLILLVIVIPEAESMVNAQLEKGQELLAEVSDVGITELDEEGTTDPVIDRIRKLETQTGSLVIFGNDLSQIQLKTSLDHMMPYMKSLMEVIKIGAFHAYKGSEWCCKNVLPPLYHSLVFVLKHWVAFVQNGGEFTAPKVAEKKPDVKVDLNHEFKMGFSSSKLSKLENLYVLEVAKMIVKGEQISIKVRRKTIGILRKVLNYEYGDLEDLLVSYFDKVLA